MGTDLAPFSQSGCSTQSSQAFELWESLAGDRLWAGQAGHLKGQRRLGDEVFSSPDSSFSSKSLSKRDPLLCWESARSTLSRSLRVPVSLGLCSWKNTRNIMSALSTSESEILPLWAFLLSLQHFTGKKGFLFSFCLVLLHAVRNP